jgi:hypothetical protein
VSSAGYVEHDDIGCPHRGIVVEMPVSTPMATVTTLPVAGRVERVDILGGLIQEPRAVATFAKSRTSTASSLRHGPASEAARSRLASGDERPQAHPP